MAVDDADNDAIGVGDGVLGWVRALVSAFMGIGYWWARLAGNGAVSGLGGKGEVAAYGEGRDLGGNVNNFLRHSWAVAP